MIRFAALLLLACPVAAADLPQYWGGEHVDVVVVDDKATVEFDCAHGRARDWPEHNGHFVARGTYTPEHPGPTGGPEVSFPVFYVGEVTGNSMTMMIADSEEGSLGVTVTLTRGQRGVLRKCR